MNIFKTLAGKMSKELVAAAIAEEIPKVAKAAQIKTDATVQMYQQVGEAVKVIINGFCKLVEENPDVVADIVLEVKRISSAVGRAMEQAEKDVEKIFNEKERK